uniref:Uncharacterized protein n=1 Tax=Tanacetum cinerariifolium TaxID=118510 RepID=A0A6L2K8U4_TANCI|nr:hypothetical protein [Tanacetum cinerariifolium]
MNGFKECSSCEALYTKSCGCSKGCFVDKFVCDPNKTPDSSQQPPHDCLKCGNPVDGLYCRQCALLRKKLKEVSFTICDEHKFFQYFINTSKSSNDDSNVVNMPQEPFVFNQDPSKNSSQSPSHIDHHCCFGCGDLLDASWDVSSLLQQQKDQVVNLDSYSPKPLQCRKIPICYDDDDDEESSTPLRDIIISKLPSCIAITPVLSTKETKDSLIIGDEHLDTIPEKELDEFTKSSVENLVPNPSESEDERECDVPICDDFTTFSNLLFDADDDFSSSDDESLSDEDISKEIYSNPLFNEEILRLFLLLRLILFLMSSLVNLFFSISIPPGIDEADCDPEEEIRLIEKFLYDNSSPRPSEEFNSENSDAVIKSFSLSPIPFEDNDPFMEEIDLSLTSDGSIPPGIDSDYSDSERENLFPKRLLHDDPVPLLDILDFSNVVRIFPPSSPIW